MNQFHVARLLLDKTDAKPNCRCPLLDDTPLHMAALYGGVQLVHLLCSQSETDVNARAFMSHTPLHRAKCTEIIRVLLAQPALDVNAQCSEGRTALHGLNVNLRDNNGNTPLHAMAKNSCTAAITALLCHQGVDLNIRDNSGKTPLAIARERQNWPLFKVLEARGATL